mmetsp:Transcript_29424/g.66445  ORF Transcript_29424/g.66445 Transcript_29424/m.66445 type:complete len:225 (+) Transcript_29424:253-927(+)
MEQWSLHFVSHPCEEHMAQFLTFVEFPGLYRLDTGACNEITPPGNRRMRWSSSDSWKFRTMGFLTGQQCCRERRSIMSRIACSSLCFFCLFCAGRAGSAPTGVGFWINTTIFFGFSSIAISRKSEYEQPIRREMSIPPPDSAFLMSREKSISSAFAGLLRLTSLAKMSPSVSSVKTGNATSTKGLSLGRSKWTTSLSRPNDISHLSPFSLLLCTSSPAVRLSSS